MSTFAAKPVADADKLRGGYYTPAPIAKYLARWVAEAGDRLLEPACGDGAVLSELTAAARRSSRVTGIELFAAEAQKSRSAGGTVLTADFFDWFTPEHHTSFDGVAGNPPYIRFGNWPEHQRSAALELMRSAGLKVNRLTNAWVPFTVASVLALREGGRVGLVLPAEMLQVTYASMLRKFLIDNLSSIDIVSFRTLVFPGVLQEVVLLLGVRGEGPAYIRTLEVDTSDELSDISFDGETGAPALVHEKEKWTKYFLTPEQIHKLRELQSTDRIGTVASYAEVDVGVVTGRNSFFTMTRSEAEERGLMSYVMPLVARSNQLSGISFTETDLDKLEAEDARCQLLALTPELDIDRYSALRDYVSQGEEAKVHTGYKCSIRRSWWSVPSVWVPDAFMLRQIHTYPRAVANGTDATSTDTVHRVRVRDVVSTDQLCAGLINSVTFASAEIQGRSYGGGILELEPTEAERLLVPSVELLTRRQVKKVDDHLRSGRLEDALNEVDRTLLVDQLGWKWDDVLDVRHAWQRLRDRRHARGRKSR